MIMRKEIYERVTEALSGIAGAPVKHIDLWNHNVEFIEQEEGWARPAVFVEFSPIEWLGDKSGGYRTHGRLRLHIVTDWAGSSAMGSAQREESLRVFDLCERIREAMLVISGESFGNVRLLGSETNHNHEEIVESIEEFGYSGIWRE